MTEKHERRTFLSKLLGGALAVGVVGVIGAVMAYLFPPERRGLQSGAAADARRPR
jgi:hypothetical protein